MIDNLGEVYACIVRVKRREFLNWAGIGWSKVIQKLNQSPEDVNAFKQAYNSGINEDNIKDALATFQRSLYTPNAPFDLYLRGNKKIDIKNIKKT